MIVEQLVLVVVVDISGAPFFLFSSLRCCNTMLSRAVRYSLRRQHSTVLQQRIRMAAFSPLSGSSGATSTLTQSALNDANPNGETYLASGAAASFSSLANAPQSAGFGTNASVPSFDGKTLRYELVDERNGILMVTFENKSEKVRALYNLRALHIDFPAVKSDDPMLSPWAYR